MPSFSTMEHHMHPGAANPRSMIHPDISMDQSHFMDQSGFNTMGDGTANGMDHSHDISVHITNAEREVESVVQSLEPSYTEQSFSNNNTSNPQSVTSSSSYEQKKSKKLDLTSEEAFPALGGVSGNLSKPKSLFAAFADIKPINNRAAKSKSATWTARPVEHASSLSVELVDFVPTMTPTLNGPTAALAAEVKYIQSKTNTRVSMSKRDGIVVFNLRGPNMDDLEIAKRMIVARVTPKITTTLQIPTSCRSKIVGQGGKVIQGITLRTQVNIDLAKPKISGSNDSGSSHQSINNASPDDTAQSLDEDVLEDYNNVPMSLIKFTGDAQGIELAKAEVLAIIGHHAVKKCAKLSTKLVPAAMYPFVLGPHGSNVANLESDFDVKISVPASPYISFPPNCPYILPSNAESIVITGPEQNVRAARSAILSVVAELNENIGEISVSIDKRKHKFILGPSGSNIHELLSITGCIIELPTDSNANNNQITVRGPAQQLPTALQMVMTKSVSVQALEFDITPFVAGAKSTSTGSVYVQYLIACQYNALKEIEENSGAQIVFPTGSDVNNLHVLEIAGSSKKVVESCNKQLSDYLQTKGTFFYNNVRVPRELFHHTTIKSALANAQKELEADGLVFDYAYLTKAEFADEITMVVFDPAHGPLSAKKGHTKSKAPTAKTKVANDVSKAAKSVGEFITKLIRIPTKHHRYLTESVLNELNTEHSKTPGIPLIVRVGSRDAILSKADFEPVQLAKDEIVLRGLKAEVESLAAHLMNMSEQADRADEMGNNELTFSVPSRIVSQLVGRGGAGLAPFRERVGIKKVEIGLADGDHAKVLLRGTVEANSLVKKAIMKRVGELEDLTSTTIQVPNEYHGKIIGEKGKYVKRLEEKYAVRIEFPRSDSAADPNAITVQGGKKGVKEAVAEIRDLYNYEKANNFTESIVVPAYVIPVLVGKSGMRINQLMQLTGARVDVSANRKSASNANIPDASNASNQTATSEEATIVGSKEEVGLAKQVIKELIHVLRVSGYSWPSVTIDVPSALHSRIVGPGARMLRETLKPFNTPAGKTTHSAPTSAPEEIKTLVRTIYNMRLDANEQSDRVDVRFLKNNRNVAIIKGETMELVDKVKALLEKKITDMQSETKLVMSLPTQTFPSLIGAGGAGVQELQSNFNVGISFDRLSTNSDHTDTQYQIADDRDDLRQGPLGSVVISGSVEATELCAAAILAKLPYKRTIDIPASHKQIFRANSGAVLKKIRDTGVLLSVPPKGKFKDEDDETWGVRGDKVAVDQALAIINEILASDPDLDPRSENGRNFTVVQTITDIEQRLHRFVIGTKGQTITEIRTATSTVIDVPPQQDRNDAIVIRGQSQQDVDEAEQMIRDAVNRASGR